MNPSPIRVSIPQNAAEAIEWQLRLREQVIEKPLPLDEVEVVAATDLSFEQCSDDVWAGIVVWRIADGAVVDRAVVRTRASFPYIPGLLSFRETPPLLEAWAKLKVLPDAVLCDAHGRAHPRRFGMACHFGLIVGLPTVGCAKSLLCGQVETMSPVNDWLPICDGEEIIGAAVFTRPRARPVYVSVGHLVDLPSAAELVRRCAHGYRLPEPLRLVHQLVTEQRRQAL